MAAFYETHPLSGSLLPSPGFEFGANPHLVVPDAMIGNGTLCDIVQQRHYADMNQQQISRNLFSSTNLTDHNPPTGTRKLFFDDSDSDNECQPPKKRNCMSRRFSDEKEKENRRKSPFIPRYLSKQQSDPTLFSYRFQTKHNAYSSTSRSSTSSTNNIKHCTLDGDKENKGSDISRARLKDLAVQFAIDSTKTREENRVRQRQLILYEEAIRDKEQEVKNKEDVYNRERDQINKGLECRKEAIRKLEREMRVRNQQLKVDKESLKKQKAKLCEREKQMKERNTKQEQTFRERERTIHKRDKECRAKKERGELSISERERAMNERDEEIRAKEERRELAFSERDRAINEHEQAISKQEHVINKRERAVNERELAISEDCEELCVKEEQCELAIRERDQAFNERDEELRTKEERSELAFSERDRVINGRERVINERERAINERERAFKQAINEREQTIKEREQAIKEQQQAIEDREQVINERGEELRAKEERCEQRVEELTHRLPSLLDKEKDEVVVLTRQQKKNGIPNPLPSAHTIVDVSKPGVRRSIRSCTALRFRWESKEHNLVFTCSDSPRDPNSECTKKFLTSYWGRKTMNTAMDGNRYVFCCLRRLDAKEDDFPISAAILDCRKDPRSVTGQVFLRVLLFCTNSAEQRKGYGRVCVAGIKAVASRFGEHRRTRDLYVCVSADKYHGPIASKFWASLGFIACDETNGFFKETLKKLKFPFSDVTVTRAQLEDDQSEEIDLALYLHSQKMKRI